MPENGHSREEADMRTLTRESAGRGAWRAAKWLIDHVSALGLIGGAAAWLMLPRVESWAQEQGRVAVAAQMAQQASLLGALACLQAGGVVLPGACAFPLAGGGARAVPLDDINGLLAALAVRPADGR